MAERVLVALLLAFCVAIYLKKRKQLGLPLPPGPSGLPFLGSVLKWPKGHAWVEFNEWTKEFGDVVHISMMGNHVVILGKYSSAKLFLDKSTVASRPQFPMAGDLMGLAATMVLAPHDPHWKKMRRLTHIFMGKNYVEEFSGVLQSSSKDLVTMMYKESAKPWNNWDPLRKCIGEQIFTSLAENALDRISYALIVGSFWVDAFPTLKYIPPWFPGAHFRRHGADTRHRVFDMVNLPFEHVKKDMSGASCPPSVTRNMLERLTEEKDTDESGAKWATGSLYGAGMEPVYAAMTTLILAMVLNPSVQEKVQAELDGVTGKKRLPTYEDRDELPYFSALLQETLRWHPPIPLGVPHCTTSDETYLGFSIPQNSTVFANLWGIGRDGSIYREPESFRPERFLGPDAELSPENWVFGFGRRACVGTHYARLSLFIYAASILQTFEIAVPDGITVQPEFSPNTNSFALPFPVKFVPRVDWLEALKGSVP
ncbi:cytochrome P450 [Collybia nuda]|uniref:Cytochrome P450 n=1 Tax=Collybia nuda TaxID=64659 RepID=A0A9P5YAH1_9AGAR|nr:cytochrome P450 [Collybia nuda]